MHPPTTKEKDKQRLPDAVKLSRDEKAARAAVVLASRENQAIQIDPVTPAKAFLRKRSADVPMKSSNISVKKKKGQIVLEEPSLTPFAQISAPRKVVNMKIKVLMLWYTHLYSQARPRSITFIAVDMEGSLFEFVIPDTISQKWSTRIKEGKVYILRHVLSSENEKRLNVIETRFQMNITKDTKCVKINKEMEIVDVPPLTKLCDLHLVRAKETTFGVDFVVYVIDVRPLSIRTQKKGDPLRYVEVYVVDQSLNTTATVLTVWDNIYEDYIDLFGHGFTKPFVLTAIGMKVKDFRGRFTLNASNFTKFFSGPHSNMPAASLQEWVTTNYQLRILSKSDLLHPDRLITLSEPENLMTIRDVKQSTPDYLSDNQVLRFVVHGTILEIDVENQFHYDACEQCNNSPGGDRSLSNQSCGSCGKNPVKVVPRYLLGMKIGDSRDVIKVTAFDRDAQVILYMQVEKALEMRSEQNGVDELKRIAEHSVQSSYTFTLMLNAQSLKFLHRSGYKVQMLDWIPRHCLQKLGSDSLDLEGSPTMLNAPLLSSNGASASLSSDDSYIEVDSSSPSNASVSKSK